MKKLLLLLTLTCSISIFSQSKKELKLQIETYAKNAVMNQAYNFDKQKVFDAAYIMMKKEYPTITAMDSNKGIISGYSEGEQYKESLTTEIIGNGPYRCVFSMKKQIRHINSNGSYTGWYDQNQISGFYLYKIQYEIYEVLFGPLPIPGELAAKITAYNDKQKKDKNKSLAGRDY